MIKTNKDIIQHSQTKQKAKNQIKAIDSMVHLRVHLESTNCLALFVPDT